MENYYECLGLAMDASSSEIDEMCDLRYNEARHLVYSHDFETRRKAELVIKQIEEIRIVLLDDQRREVYDTELQGLVSGLSTEDSVAYQNQTAQTLPFLSGGNHLTRSNSSYQCPSCHAETSPEQNHCAKCGFSLKRTCLKCGAINTHDSTYCISCGESYAEALATVEREREEREEAELAREKERIMAEKRRQELVPYIKRIESARWQSGYGWWIISFLGLHIVALIFWLMAFFTIRSIEKKNVVLETDYIYSTLLDVKRRAKTNLIICAVLDGIALLCFLGYLIFFFSAAVSQSSY